MNKWDNIKILIVPDVHGRTFWKEPVIETINNNNNAKIVFLGDYLSPYTYYENITNTESINVFKEIIELAINNKNIKLLIGNHDGSVIGPDYVCEFRLDYRNKKSNQKLFIENQDLFDICYETEINSKTFLLSHAGYIDDWLNKYKDYFESVLNKTTKLSDFLNNKLHLSFNDEKEHDDFWYIMSDFDVYRGGVDLISSIIWTDAKNLLRQKNIKENLVQIVGHTILKNGLNYKNSIYCLDCQECFYIDTEGNIKPYNEKSIMSLA